MSTIAGFTCQIFKEFRLLRSAWIAAAVLACVPLTALSEGWQLSTLCVGFLLLALRSFGAEFSDKTFTLFYSQPVPRNQLWFLKFSALAVAFGSIFALRQIAILFKSTDAIAWAAHPLSKPGVMAEEMSWLVVIAVMLIGSGTFYSLLLREVAAALWATIIGPFLIALLLIGGISTVVPEQLNGSLFDILFRPALLLYGGLCGVAAWCKFRYGQDLDRFSAVVENSLPFDREGLGLARWGIFRSATVSLFAKEIGLQLVTGVVSGLLVLFYAGALCAQRWWVSPGNQYMEVTVDLAFMMLVWLPPFLIGCMAIAEERRIGVSLLQITAPVSMTLQWLVKIAVVFGMSICISEVLPFFIHSLIGEGAPVAKEVHYLSLIIIGIATGSLFLSSLAKGFLGAFSLAVGTTIGLGSIVVAFQNFFRASTLFRLGFSDLWLRDTWFVGLFFLSLLLLAIALPLALLLLTHRNMKRPVISGRDVSFNVVAILSTVTLSLVVAYAAYSRVWEVFLPMPKPSPEVKLSGTTQPRIESFGGALLLLPDGRLLSAHFPDDQLLSNPSFMRINTRAGNTTWRDVSSGHVSAYGIRSDGTLWSWGTLWSHPESEIPRFRKRMSYPRFYTAPTQLGTDSDWVRVFARQDHAFGIKQDGSLWGWGDNKSMQLGDGTTNSTTLPIRIGHDTDWVQVATSFSYSLGIKKDGSLWEWGTRWGSGHQSLARRQTSTPTLKLPHGKWTDVCVALNGFAAINEDGTLWFFSERVFDLSPKESRDRGVMIQLGTASSWKCLYDNYSQIAAQKRDGSLWMIRMRNPFSSEFSDATSFETSTNWIAASDIGALAADGSFIGWPRHPYLLPPENKKIFLGPSRIPPFAVNILKETQQ